MNDVVPLEQRVGALESQLRDSDSAARDRLSRLRAWLGFVKFLVGTVALAVLAAVLNQQIQNRSLAMKEQEQQQEYVKQFVAQALDDNLEKRVRFAHYFSSVLGRSWNVYYDGVKSELDRQTAELEAKRSEAQRLTQEGSTKDEQLEALKRRIRELEGNVNPSYAPPLMSLQQESQGTLRDRMMTSAGVKVAPGALPVGTMLTGSLQQGGSAELQVMMEPARCYTVIAEAAAQTMRELDVALIAATPTPGMAPVLAADNTTGPEAVLGERPNCFKWAFPIAVPVRVVVKATEGSGPFVAQVWRR